MINRQKAQRILWYETIGFLLLIALSWLDEMISLPHLLFGSGEHASWHEAMMETAVLLAVWAIVFVFTRRIIARLYFLEGFLRVCAWCRQICHNEEWFALETYFAKGFNIKTSHAMCPACEKKFLADVENKTVLEK